jgi:DnaJ-domain-containing protein 1
VTYYDVLGVTPDAPTAAIRHAYVTLARRHHPDRHANDTTHARAEHEQAMRAVNEAWSVLSDPAARRRYDARLRDDARAARAAADRETRAAWRPYDDRDPDIDPRLLDDEPANTPVKPAKQMVMVLPALSFGGGVVLVAVGAVVRLAPIAVLGAIAILFSVLLFLVLPLFALSASARNDRR